MSPRASKCGAGEQRPSKGEKWRPAGKLSGRYSPVLTHRLEESRIVDMLTLVAKFESPLDAIVAYVTRSKTDPATFDVTVTDERSGLLEVMRALTLPAAITTARALTH